MNSKKPRHNLSNVDLERRTAICAVCGNVQISLHRNLKLSKTGVSCVNKQKELKQASRQRKWEKRLQDPNWKLRHQITEVDLETMTGHCSVCGLVVVYRQRIRKKDYYMCAKNRNMERQEMYRKLYFPPLPVNQPICMTPVQESRIALLNQFKVERGCKTCGYNADPNELELHFSGVDKKEFTTEKLVHFTGKRFRHALRISQVYCMICYPLFHGEPVVRQQSLDRTSAVSNELVMYPLQVLMVMYSALESNQVGEQDGKNKNNKS